MPGTLFSSKPKRCWYFPVSKPARDGPHTDARHIELRQPDARLGELIQMRCLEMVAALKTKIRVAGIVRKQQHDIRFFGSLGSAWQSRTG